jgi:anti-sigma factor ChrR (cupin superfamily)
MKGQKHTIPFRKTTACPSSKTLLYFRSGKLSSEVSALVGYHLNVCDFCRAELMLLAHHQRTAKTEPKAPEIPMNLRILAESLLNTT